MISYKNVSLKEMFDMLIKEIMEDVSDTFNRETYNKFYWKNGDGELHEIVEVDLMRGRFITEDGDFSQYEWEYKESSIYLKVEDD